MMMEQLKYWIDQNFVNERVDIIPLFFVLTPK